MNIFINTISNVEPVQTSNEIKEKRFPLIYFWLKDYYFQQSNENFSKTSWSFSDDEILIDKNSLLQQQFKNTPPDIVGISLYTWNEHLLLKNARWLKENYPDVLIVVAGPSAESNILFFQKHPYVDVVVLGPGAETFRRIIDAKLSNSDYKKVDGISYVDSGNLITNKNIPRKHDPLVLNYVNNFRDEVAGLLDQYFVNYDTVVFLTLLIQGCPYSCSFCEQGTALWTKLNRRPVQHVCDEIDFLANYTGIVFTFIDANFGIDSTYEKVVDYIIEKNTNSRFKIDRPTMAKNSVDVTFNLLEKMVKNNVLLEYGEYGYLALQDTNPEILKLNGRPISKEFEKIEKLKSFTKDQTKKPRVELIIGMPGQSFDTLSTTLFDLMKNDLLSHRSTPYLYSIFPNTTLTSADNQIYYKSNKVYARSNLGYNYTEFTESSNHNDDIILEYIVETETIKSEEIMAVYYMFVLLGHLHGSTEWIKTPLNYLKNYHGVSEQQFVAAYAESFAPRNWHLLPKPVSEDLQSLHRWFIGQDKFLHRMDNQNNNTLSMREMAIYRFHSDYSIVSDFFKTLFEQLIGKSTDHLDKLMEWQAAKTLDFNTYQDNKIVSYNYDDIASQKTDVFYKSCFEFEFNAQYIPKLIVHDIDPVDQLELHINDIKNNHFNSI
jgi:radical SAM superfamily enzyme YgiQ (UPF0313 family)